MELYETRRERLKQILREMSAADLAEASGIAASTLSRYKKEPDEKGAKNISEINARRIETAARKTTYWLDGPPAVRGSPTTQKEVAHALSHLTVEDAPHVEWGEQMTGDDLPPVFWATLPDDSMAPRATAGKKMCFDRGMVPRPGDGVLVVDRAGGVAFRLYRSAGAGRWTAAAMNPAYEPLDSERDGLRVLAVLKAEEGRWS